MIIYWTSQRFLMRSIERGSASRFAGFASPNRFCSSVAACVGLCAALAAVSATGVAGCLSAARQRLLSAPRRFAQAHGFCVVFDCLEVVVWLLLRSSTATPVPVIRG